jgi:isopentenyl-diphosphate delta-isomerase
MQESPRRSDREPDRRNAADPPEGTASRKRDHVELCLDRNVTFREKTTGLDRYELEHNALPELDLDDVDTGASFLGKQLQLPLIVSSMTGGYPDATRINRELAEVCEELGIGMGVGSQRQALERADQHESFRVAREAAPSIPLFGNIGAAELAAGVGTDQIKRLAELIRADGFAVHLNPLQELMQPEGTPRFKGVLAAIERLVKELGIPVIVKEVGAGLSAEVVTRLVGAGVRTVDIAGAGGTSWSGVEILRREDGARLEEFWDWGIPTADAVKSVRAICDRYNIMMIASGGITSAGEVAVAIALGAHLAGVARPFLKILLEQGQTALRDQLVGWRQALRSIMFLTGSRTIDQLRTARMRVAER